MKKNLLITLLVLFISVLSFASTIKNGQIKDSKNGLNVIVDKRIEMLAIVQYLAGYEMIDTSETPYLKRVDSYFSPYKNHKAVHMYKEMIAADIFGYDAPVVTMLYLDENFKINGVIEEQLVRRASGHEKLNEFILQLQAFNRDTGFDKFFKQNSTYYRNEIKAIIEKDLNDFSEIQRVNEFYKVPQNSYNYIYAALFIGGYGPKIKASNGKYDLYTIQGRFDDVEYLTYITRHEFSHSFVNPLVDKNLAELDKYNKLADPIMSKMEAINYGEWRIMLYEHIVRAVTTAMAYKYEGEEEAEKLLKQEYGSGFIYVENLYLALRKYMENNNANETFETFFPELINVIAEYSTQDIVYKSLPSFLEYYAESPKFAMVYSTNESSDELNKKIKDKTIKDSKGFFKVPKELIFPDTIAVNTDLSDYFVVTYGSLEGNAYLKKLKDFPVKVKDNGICTDKYMEGRYRIIAMWQNPDNPENGVLAYTGTDGEMVVNINRVPFGGKTDYIIANKDFKIIEAGSYIFKDGKFTF